MKRVLLLLAFVTTYSSFGAEKAPTQTKADSAVHITLGDLAAARPSLQKLFAFDMPVKTAWTLRKTVAAIEAELKHFEDQRQALVKKYGKPDEKGGFNVPPDKLTAFQDEFKLLTSITVDLNITPVSVSSLGEGVRLSAGDMLVLEPFLRE